MARSGAGESVLSRVVRIFEAFTPDETTLGISEIARRAGLPLPTASRLVAELVRHGLLAREPGRRVRIGVRAMPFMEDAHSVIGHHVQLGVLDGDEVIFVERLSAPQAVINYTRIAGRLPLHVSSSGLVLLAHAPGEVQERILARPLVRYTPNTITAPRRLRALLAEVRRQGYAHCPGYVHEDALGIAVPVRDGTHAVVAALSAIVPTNANRRTVTGVLSAAARGIGRALGLPDGSAQLASH